MRASSQIQNHFGSITVLSIVLAVFLASLTGLFGPADDYCYDGLQRMQPPSHQSSGVLLVYTPRSFFNEEDCNQLSQLANELLGLNAKRIGFLFTPDKQQLSVLNEHPFADKFVVGNSLQEAAHEDMPTLQRPLKPTVEQGFLNLRLNQSVYREHPTRIENERQTYDSFELALAKPYLPADDLPPANLGIRFSGGQNGLPHINAQELLNHEIVSELVQGTIVLVGPEPNDEIGFATPTTSGALRMSQLELHGNILNTLLNQNGFKSVGIVTACVVLLLATMLFCQVFRQISSGQVLVAYVGSLLFVLLFSWLALHLFSAKLPITSMLVSTSLVLLTSLSTRLETLKSVVDGWYLMRLSGRAIWKPEDKDTWTLISDSVYQIFYPNRMVLMELDSGATHLKVTKTIHCSTDDILERRRDVNREPYRTAVSLGAATPIHNRQFFEINHDKDCIEFVVPLILVSELVGFMVLEMTTESVRNWDDFENFLTKFSSDMAVLASKYRILRQQESQQKHCLERLRQVPEQLRKISLFQAEVEHCNLEKLLSDAFETIQTAGVIYDVFGRPIKTNAKMVELLQRNGIVVDDTDCISMLESLTSWSKNDCRKLFRQCVVEGRTQQIFIPSEDKREAPRVLYLEPLNKGDDEPEICSRCVCIQVVEGKIFQESRTWQQEFVNNNLQQVSDRLDKLQKLADQLRNSGTRKASSVNHPLATKILDSIAECRSILDDPFGEDPDNYMSVDSHSIWESCLEKLRPKMDARCIKIVPQMDAGRLEVVANPFLLERTFETILECVTHDAVEDTEIVVRSEIVANTAYYHFSDNTGGAPLHDFRRSLEVAASSENDTIQGPFNAVLTPSQIDQFREIESWLEVWGARLSIRCNENYRIQVDLALVVQEDYGVQTNSTQARNILPKGS